MPPYTWLRTLVDEQAQPTALSYRRYRFTSSATGRFTQPDPIGLAGGLNLYGYAGGDPINFSDPFGLCPKSAGGDGKTEEMSDCPRGSSGWWAWRDAQGEGSTVYNHLRGWLASANEAGPDLPEGTLMGVPPGAGGPGRGLRATAHGAMRMAQSGRLSETATRAAIDGATRIGVQRDGARVFIQEVGGRFNLVVVGERGVVTNMANLSQRSLDRLARRYGYEF